jgi:SHS2 domain-containing protein
VQSDRSRDRGAFGFTSRRELAGTARATRRALGVRAEDTPTKPNDTITRPTPFRQVDHTADLEIEVEAAGPGELYACCALALAELLAGESRPAPRDDSLTLEAHGPDRETRLKRLLDQLLRRWERDGWSCAEARIASEDEAAGVVHLDIRGGPLPRSSDQTEGHDIKAITFHRLAFEPVSGASPPRWRARIVFDI